MTVVPTDAFQAIRHYLHYVRLDGDWANDWLTHIPVIIRPFIEAIGHLLTITIGA